MAEVTATLIQHRKRLNEIASVLVHHGLAAGRRGAGIAGVEPVEHLINRVISPDELEMSEGQRLRGALTELGTTFIKFGQMLSLRPDMVGEDIATELAELQASVPPDAPGVAQATVEADLGRSVAKLYGSFEPEPFASGSVAQVHRATLPDGTPVAVKVLHAGADTKVRDDVELMRAIAEYLEAEDPQLASSARRSSWPNLPPWCAPPSTSVRSWPTCSGSTRTSPTSPTWSSRPPTLSCPGQGC